MIFKTSTTSDVSVGQELSLPAAITDTGAERELNEDRYGVVECPSGIAWIVCDGMGGETGGELAAQIAIDAIRRELEAMPPRVASAAFKGAVSEANRIIVLRRQNPAFASMGTTFTGALFQGKEIAISNIGDSRAYIVRSGAIEQLTSDHTLVQQMVESGEITNEEALSHPKAHVLTRCIGAQPSLQLDTVRFWLWDTPADEEHDVLVLCTDGLYSMVDDGEIASLVSELSPQEACGRMVEMANERGGYDNITVAIIPLSGQLRREMPADYDEDDISRMFQQHVGTQQISEDQSLARTLGITLVLSAISALIVILYVMYLLNK
jgi:protein phosphatase